MITYSKDAWTRSSEAWRDYGPEWAELRQMAAAKGILFPPKGTRHDDRDDPSPSQRSIVYRALEDNPTELKRILRSSTSWSQVIERIFGMEARLRSEAGLEVEDIRTTRDEALMSLGQIFKRLEEQS